MKPFRKVILVALASSACAEIPIEDEDILEIAKKKPLNMVTAAGPSKYGDPNLAEAVDALADIPHPWTVAKIIDLFTKQNDAWSQKLPSEADKSRIWLGEGGDKQVKRCGYLITLLAASRDPRAAVVLANALDNPSSHVQYFAMRGLFHYFLYDLRYRQLPPKRNQETTNFLPEMKRQVLEWWAINKGDLDQFTTGQGNLK